MNKLLFKFDLFICIWYEIAAEFCLSGDTAFFLGLLAWGCCVFAVRIALHALGLLGPTAFGLLVQGLLWLGLFWWWAPALAKAQPLVAIIVALGVLALIGGALRRLFEREYARHGRDIWREHSVAVVVSVLTSLGLGMVGTMQLHSLWGLAAYGLLVGLPVRAGWSAVPRLTHEKSDAKFGTAEAFQKAGYSEER